MVSSFPMRKRILILLAAVPAGLVPRALAAQGPPAAFEVAETTIESVQTAMRAGRLTCRRLVEAYLARIAAYDRQGPGINAIILTNLRVLSEADSLDRLFQRSGPVGPLHCIPMIVKDNFDTRGLPTTAGSLSLQGFIPDRDAFQVQRIRAAGALVLAKSNMAEFAFSPYETVSSILPGYTKNPYVLDRVTAGSSGGTAAAVAASYGTVGLGTDTGNSIRGPSAHQALVGIRSTMGLTSRAGVVPLNLAADIAGPMARTVRDAVAVFQVVAGEDPADSVTAAAHGRVDANYVGFLRADGLRGARVGALNQAWERESTDPEVRNVFRAALADFRRQGATVIDSVPLPGFDSLLRTATGCNRFRHDIEAYFASHAQKPPVTSVAEILRSRRFHPSLEARLQSTQAMDSTPDRNPGCVARAVFAESLRRMVLEAMDRLQLDALIYPTWSNPPRLIGDLNTPHGDNSQLFSPATGFPAVNVPMGWLRDGRLPAGLTLLGRPWSEGTLFKLAYGYEQATHHRRPPAATPPL
jgi:amidase